MLTWLTSIDGLHPLPGCGWYHPERYIFVHACGWVCLYLYLYLYVHVCVCVSLFLADTLLVVHQIDGHGRETSSLLSHGGEPQPVFGSP